MLGMLPVEQWAVRAEEESSATRHDFDHECDTEKLLTFVEDSQVKDLLARALIELSPVPAMQEGFIGVAT